MSKNKTTKPEKSSPNIFNILIVFFLITLVINMLASSFIPSNQSEISYTQFLQLVENQAIEAVELSESEIQIVLREDVETQILDDILNDGKKQQTGWLQPSYQDITYSTGRVDDPNLVRMLTENGVDFSQPIVRSSPFLSVIISWVLPVVLLYLLYSFFMRNLMKRMGADGEGGFGGMIGGVGKSKAKMYNLEKNTGITFKDVAGQDEAKESLAEMVDFLHNPEKYQKIGAKQPKGALLVGPPGTGKTLLAKAVAGEAGVPFYHLTGSEFVEMFVGVGASRVRDLFETANKNAPCIVFIDEIDAIGKSRDNQLGSNDEREQTLNQLLSEMDGFDSSKGIVVLAATNRPEVLDKALLRPGRFDRRIIVEKPDLPGREAILKVHSAKVKLGDDVNLHSIAILTSGATGADLANMINEAALLAVKMGRETVAQQDLVEAVELVIAGKEKKDRILSMQEKRMVSYHEVGHALVSALQKNSQPVQKITIVPRTMGSLGYTINAPEEEKYLMTKEELLAQITTLLGGRAAELVEFNSTSTGASNDIERATKLARSMVTQYGMSEKFGAMALESMESRYLDGRNVSICSQQTETLIDEEVRKILDACQESAIDLLKSNIEPLKRISEYLLEKENITGEEFMQLLNESKN